MLGAPSADVEPRLMVKASELDEARAVVAEEPTEDTAERGPEAPDFTVRPDRDDERVGSAHPVPAPLDGARRAALPPSRQGWCR